MQRLSSLLFHVDLAISSVIGAIHFFAPYAFTWYSYISDAPPAIHASMDYVNFFFLLLSGLSIICPLFKKRSGAVGDHATWRVRWSIGRPRSGHGDAGPAVGDLSVDDRRWVLLYRLLPLWFGWVGSRHLRLDSVHAIPQVRA